VPGVQGPAGVQGPVGFQGRQGVQGAAGAQGPQGTAPVGGTGVTGVGGAQGPSGFQGRQGAQGPQGPQGLAPTGAAGATGPAGLAGATGVLTTASTPNVSALGVNTPAPPTGEIRATGNITAFFSDKRLKTKIEVIENCLDKIMSMTGIYYTQNRLAEKYGYNDYSRQVGLIAQQIQLSVPEVVDRAPFDVDENGNSMSGHNFLAVQYEKLIPILTQAVKEQQVMIQQMLVEIENRGK
jgi:hypothetical protein